MLREKEIEQFAERLRRDQIVIMALSFVCVLLFLTSVSGVNIFAGISALITAQDREASYWLQWLVLVVAIATFFWVNRISRELDFDNKADEIDLEGARQRALGAASDLDKKIELLIKQQKVDSR